ncbi:MAG TPA: c-type cytochrome domain-containing protein [Planctomycetota bacterium]|nr:c-type cytochrome domain-containing protein [Planctomycetota bacterium]
MQRLLLSTLLIGLLGAALRGQDPPREPAPQQRLLRLLRELRSTDPKVWEARLADLEQQARVRDAEAKTLREQATDLQRRADAAAAAAAALRAEQAKLVELQKVLSSLPTADPTQAPAGEAKPSAAPAKSAPDPAAAPEPKPEPKKAQAAGAAAPAAVMPTAKPPATAPAMKDGGGEPAELVTWATVAPIFAESCTGCHDPDAQKGGLDLSTFAAARNGGGSGQSLVAGDPEQSRLYRMVTRQERPFMPRDADPLSNAQTKVLRTWIEQGAAEDAAGARAFLAERAAMAKAAGAAADAAKLDEGAAPMPGTMPTTALRTPHRPGPVASLVRSPRAPLLAMPGLQQVLLCDAELRPIGVLPCDLAHVGAVAFAEDGSAVLAAGGEPGRRGSAVLFDVRSGAVLTTCGAEKDCPLAAAVHRGAGLVALGGSSKRARVLRIADGAEVLAGRHDDFVLCLAFDPAGKLLAAGDRAGSVQLWETAGGRIFQTLAGHQGAVHAVAFDRTGKSLLTAGADGTLRLWDVAAAKERWRQNAHPGQQALAAAFGPGDAVASCGSDGVIAVFSAAGRPVARSPAAGEWLYAVAFGADDAVVWAGDWLGRVHRFDVAKKVLTSKVPLAPAQPALQ